MASADVDMDIYEEDIPLQPGRREAPAPPSLIRYYQALEILPEKKGELHNLLQKQPAVLGSLQLMSGILSVAVGILCAATHNMHYSYFILFRVPLLTGILFIIVGLISNLLFKYPLLLNVSLAVNLGCIVVSLFGAILTSIDLARLKQDDLLFRIEMLGLCVLGLEALLSVVLCFWLFKEKKGK